MMRCSTSPWECVPFPRRWERNNNQLQQRRCQPADVRLIWPAHSGDSNSPNRSFLTASESTQRRSCQRSSSRQQRGSLCETVLFTIVKRCDLWDESCRVGDQLPSTGADSAPSRCAGGCWNSPEIEVRVAEHRDCPSRTLIAAVAHPSVFARGAPAVPRCQAAVTAKYAATQPQRQRDSRQCAENLCQQSRAPAAWVAASGTPRPAPRRSRS